MNDIHGYLEPHPEVFWGGRGFEYRTSGGIARIAWLVNQARKHNPGGVLLLDNGDTLHGTYPAVQTQGQALIPILNTLQPQAMTAHWEFAYGPQVFKQRAAELDYPVLALNVREQASGKLFFPPYQVLDVAGRRVGVIGLASNIVDKTMPPHFSAGLSFSLGKEDLPAAIDTLRRQEKVGLIILLSHLGFPQDMRLLSDVHGVDICLSAHTHNRIYQPARQGDAWAIQSGSHGSFVGRLDLELDGERISNVTHQLIEVSSDLPSDPQVESLVSAALSPFRSELDEIVGETATPLHRALNLETPMDDFLLQAIQASTGVQLALSNGWRYGAPVVPGKVTLNDLYNITPMDPPVSTVELTGEELRTIIEENLEHTYARDPYRQMGGYVKRARGLKVYFKVENPFGQRIQKLFVGGEEIQSGKIYPTAFVTEQGVPAKYGQNRQQHTERAVDAMRRYLVSASPLQFELEHTFVMV